MSALLDLALSALQVKKGSYGKVRSCTDSLVGAATITGIAFVPRMVVTYYLSRSLCCSNAIDVVLRCRPDQSKKWIGRSGLSRSCHRGRRGRLPSRTLPQAAL